MSTTFSCNRPATQRVSDIHSAATQEEATSVIATERLAYDQALLQDIQRLLERKGDFDPTYPCGTRFSSWPKHCETYVQHRLAQIADPDTKRKAQRTIGGAWTEYILKYNLEHAKDSHLAKIPDETVRSIAREGLEKRAVEKVKMLTQNKNFEKAEKVISQIQTPSIQKEAQQILDASLFGRIKHLLTKTKYNRKYDASKSSDCRGCYWPEDLAQTTEKMVSQISDPDIQQQAKKSIEHLTSAFLTQRIRPTHL